MTLNISNKSQTQQILSKYGFKFKKSLGQNFLIEPKILDKIVDTAEIDLKTGVVEIGPGIGALTQKLAERAGKVVAIEIDQRLIPILDETLTGLSNIKVICGDVLMMSLKTIIKEELSDFEKVKVVANLPYYVTSPILMKILEEKIKVLDSITVMIQKEVAERISAKPGGKDYGSLTIAVEYYANARISFHVPNTVFIPKPNVESAILNLNIRDTPPVEARDEKFLFELIKASFAQRRKTLLNNLINNLYSKEQKEQIEEILLASGVDPKRRAETLTLKEFADLSNILKFSLTL